MWQVLEDSYNLFHFNREVAELNVYISSKEIVANSNDLGRDYEHVQVRLMQLTYWLIV